MARKSGTHREEDIKNQWVLVLEEEHDRYYGTPSERLDPPMYAEEDEAERIS